MFQQQLSSLAILCLERNAWKDVENISRGMRNRKLHAYARKRIKEIAEQIADKGTDEMENLEESDTEEDADNADGIF